MSVVPSSMTALFERAGWFPGRHVDVLVDAPPDHPAYSLLAELSGISLVRPSSHVVEVDFQPVSMAAGRVVAWAAALRTHMAGIAETYSAHGELYMTAAGHVIGCSLVHDAFWLEGRTFAEAMERIWSSARARPMLLPGQQETILDGITYRRGDPAILTPDSPELQ